jgi:hypothetical protein
MKRRMILFASVLGFFIPHLATAQDRPGYDLNTLLRDSAYTFNRFEEVSIALAAQIDLWKMPAELKKTNKEALSLVLRNVEAEKPALNGLLGKPRVSSGDLLDAYTEMVEIASELQGAASDDSSFGDSNMAEELARLGSKAQILGAKIGATLRLQIAAQEQELASCSQKTPSHR